MLVEDFLLFIFGLVPMYVSAIAVEKFFTNFWTGFWNIFGLLQVSVSLGLTVFGVGDMADTTILVVISVFLGLGLFLIATGGKEWANVNRRLGSSWLVSTIALVMFAWFNTYDYYLTTLAFVGNILLMALVQIFRPRDPRRQWRSLLRY